MSYSQTIKEGMAAFAGLMEEGLQRQSDWIAAVGRGASSSECQKLKESLVRWVLSMESRGYGYVLPESTFPRKVV